MNIAMKLTADGLVRALRWKALAAQEKVTLARTQPNGMTNMEISSEDANDAWRDSPAKSAV